MRTMTKAENTVVVEHQVLDNWNGATTLRLANAEAISANMQDVPTAYLTSSASLEAGGGLADQNSTKDLYS